MTGERSAKAAAVMSATAAAASIANLINRPAQAAPGDFPPEVLELLQAIAGGMASTLEQMQAILDALSTLAISVQGYPPNADYDATVIVNCQVAMTVYPVPDYPVPDDFQVLVKAHPLNAVGSLTYVSTNQAPNINMAYPLIFNEARTYRIKNTGKLRVFSNIAGSQLIVSVEQRSG